MTAITGRTAEGGDEIVTSQSGALHVKDGMLVALGKQRFTSLVASTALTVPSSSKMAFLQAETQNVRWWADGSVPTTTEGHILYAGDMGFWYAGPLDTMRLIQVAASAILTVSYFR